MGTGASRARRVPRAVQGTARRAVAAAAGGVLLLALAGCGEEVASDSVAPKAPAESAMTTDDGNPVADRYIQADALPGSWRDSEPPGPGFKQLVCGVDIEPAKPVDGGAIRYAQGGLGPFLEQHVRIHSKDTTPAAVVRDLKASLPDCTSYETKGNKDDSPTVRFEVEPLTVPGLPVNAVAWRQTAVNEARLTSDMVLVADGNALVAFVSYQLKENPDPKVIEKAVAALDETD